MIAQCKPNAGLHFHKTPNCKLLHHLLKIIINPNLNDRHHFIILKSHDHRPDTTGNFLLVYYIHHCQICNYVERKKNSNYTAHEFPLSHLQLLEALSVVHHILVALKTVFSVSPKSYSAKTNYHFRKFLSLIIKK